VHGHRRIRATVATADSPILDRMLPALGRAADNGGLWWAIGGVLALSPDPRARRGLVALGTASFTANLLLKNLVRRRRPVRT
jgi:undecaprenyl-diphosphatase